METLKELSYKNYVAKVYQTSTPENHSPFSVALWYKGRTGKIKNIYFTKVETATAALERATEWIKQIKHADAKAEQAKAERRKANSAAKASHFFQEGDILYASWGYEQTNIDFYKVIKVSKRTIDIVQVLAESVPGSIYSHGMADEVVASQYLKGDGEAYKLTVRADGSLSQGGSHKYFRKWGGNPLYRSWYH